MGQPTWIQALIPLGEEFTYKRQNPYWHNTVNIVIFLITWLAVWNIWAIQGWFPFWFYIPLGTFAIGYVFYSQLILVGHEAAHGMFVISRDPRRARKWNKFFGWLVTIPFGINFSEHWGKSHILHHNFPMEETDSENCHLRTGRELLKRIFLLLCIPGLVQIRGMLTGKGSEFDCATVGTGKWKIQWLGILALVLFWTAFIFYFIYFTPWNLGVIVAVTAFSIQIMAVLNVCRQALEHGGPIGHDRNRLLRSRTTLSPLRYLFAPWNLNYHFEHHLNQKVPWYYLGKYSRKLKNRIPREMYPYLYNKERIFDQLMGHLPGIPVELGRLTGPQRKLN